MKTFIALTTIALSILLLGCPEEDPPPPPTKAPTANFHLSYLTTEAPVEIKFINTSDLGTGRLTSYEWKSTGGRLLSTSESPIINHPISGTYEITLIVTTTHGSDSKSMDYDVEVSEPEDEFTISVVEDQDTSLTYVFDNNEEGDRLFVLTNKDRHGNPIEIIGGGYIDKHGREMTFLLEDGLPKYIVDSDGWFYKLELASNGFDVTITSSSGDEYFFPNVKVDIQDLVNLWVYQSEIPIGKSFADEISAGLNVIGLSLSIACCVTGLASTVGSPVGALCCVSATITLVSMITGGEVIGDTAISVVGCSLGTNVGDCFSLGIDLLQEVVEENETAIDAFFSSGTGGDSRYVGTWVYDHDNLGTMIYIWELRQNGTYTWTANVPGAENTVISGTWEPFNGECEGIITNRESSDEKYYGIVFTGPNSATWHSYCGLFGYEYFRQ